MPQEGINVMSNNCQKMFELLISAIKIEAIKTGYTFFVS